MSVKHDNAPRHHHQTALGKAPTCTGPHLAVRNLDFETVNVYGGQRHVFGIIDVTLHVDNFHLILILMRDQPQCLKGMLFALTRPPTHTHQPTLSNAVVTVNVLDPDKFFTRHGAFKKHLIPHGRLMFGPM